MFDFLGMRTLASGVFSLFLVLAVGRSAFGQVQPRSLDNYVAELKAARSLSTLCQQIPAIKECMVVIGDWTPDAVTFRKVVTPWLPFRRPASTVAFVAYRDHQAAD
jgi:hypothetical protein